jgi:hypothetical protein
MLLVTITLPGHDYDPGVQRPAFMSFGVQADSPYRSAGFRHEYLPADVGTVYEATAAEVNAIAGLLKESEANIGGVTMTQPYQWPLHLFWDLPRFITPHVPRVGFALEGYFVTRVTQTVDYITWSTFGGNLVGNSQQSVRLYGDVVPEPSTLIALVIGCLPLVRHIRIQRH